MHANTKTAHQASIPKTAVTVSQAAMVSNNRPGIELTVPNHPTPFAHHLSSQLLMKPMFSSDTLVTFLCTDTIPSQLSQALQWPASKFHGTRIALLSLNTLLR